jgi:acetaldehyde dehydrogenase (acetylating)
VGPGNVPAYIDRTAEVTKAVRDVLTGKTFDNGTLCSSEQSVVVDEPVAAQVEQELYRLGALILDSEQAAALQRFAILDDRSLNPAIVGKSASWIAARAGIPVPEGTRALVVRLTTVGRGDPLSCEKLSPILTMYVVDGWREGCQRCKEILGFGGMGHTLAIHCQDRAVIMQFGLEKPASRICVNTPATHGSIGYTTALAPSLTLGCGTFGNNITTDNITPLHLIQVKRLAWERTPVYPSWFTSPGPPGPVVPSDTSGVPGTVAVGNAQAAGGLSEIGAARARQATSSVAPIPVDFVCEKDVRAAISVGSQISIGPRTIVTPAARDLATEHNVFLQV